MIYQLWRLFYVFMKIGAAGFGGGYAMMSMIITESRHFAVTLQQMADLNALDMIVPGPIAINAATYVGYLHAGFWGALSATIGVSVPSFIYVSLVMRFIDRYRENKVMNGFLSGIKPAAVGLIAAASITIMLGVVVLPGAVLSNFFNNPLTTVSLLSFLIFAAAAFANIRFKINPILLTLIAALIGAFFL
jgi:chromate transporter